MSNYPLYSPKLMQKGSFCYASRYFMPSLREEETVGVVGCALDEKTEEARKRYEKFQVLGIFELRTDNIFLAQFDTMTLDSYKDYERMETPKKYILRILTLHSQFIQKFFFLIVMYLKKVHYQKVF